MDVFPPSMQREALLKFAEALDCVSTALRRDECGDPRLSGKRGLIYACAEGYQPISTAINCFLEEHNQKSQPFTWTADPDEIIAAVRRGHQALDSIH